MEVISTIGRRKAAIARVYMSEGKGQIIVNNRDFKDYFPDKQLHYVVEQPLNLLEVRENYDIKVTRMGLHPSDGLISGKELLAGPYHPAFRELVLTEAWYEKLEKLIKSPAEKIHIYVPPGQINYAIGHSARNKKFLLDYFKYVVFQTDPQLTGRTFHVDYY